MNRGFNVLDFGSGSGMYTIVASKIVGLEGEVTSVDKEGGKISLLSEKLEEQSITNVKLIKTEGEVYLPFEANYFNMILLYDVLHLIEKSERSTLLKELHRILQPNGVLSFYATHLNDLDINLDDFDVELSELGLIKKGNIKEAMFHYNWIEEGIVSNYVKS